MTLILIKFFSSAAIIALAGYALTYFADKIAEATGLGRVLAGSLLIAGATSMPELLVDLNAISMNSPNLAVGDLLGSSLFNLLILAILDFTFPSRFRRTAFSADFLHHSLSGVLSILLTSIVCLGILTHFNYGWLDVGLFTWVLLIIYIFGIRLVFSEQKLRATVEKTQRRPYKKFVLGYFISTSVIFFVAPFLTSSAEEISRISGLGETFIGTVLVALSTSLPELISTFAAFHMGAPDLALGNIFGSNTFNMLLFIPLDFAFSGILLSSVSPLHAVTALSIVAVTSVAIMGHLYRKKERIRFAEPSSEMIVVLILLSLFLNYYISKG